MKFLYLHLSYSIFHVKIVFTSEFSFYRIGTKFESGNRYGSTTNSSGERRAESTSSRQRSGSNFPTSSRSMIRTDSPLASPRPSSRFSSWCSSAFRARKRSPLLRRGTLGWLDNHYMRINDKNLCPKVIIIEQLCSFTISCCRFWILA